MDDDPCPRAWTENNPYIEESEIIQSLRKDGTDAPCFLLKKFLIRRIMKTQMESPRKNGLCCLRFLFIGEKYERLFFC